MADRAKVSTRPRRHPEVRRWLAPWQLRTVVGGRRQWFRPFEHVNVPSTAAVYIANGPYLPAPNSGSPEPQR